MLKTIKKEFNKIFNDKEAKEMKKDENVHLDLSADVTAQLAAAQATLSSQAEALEAVTSKFTEMSTLFEAATAALAAIEGEKAVLVATAAEKRLAARTEAVVASVGTEKAPALLAATETLDDVQFSAVVSALAASFETEANSAMFSEVGVSAPADAEKVVADAEITAEAKILTKKYPAKKK